MPAAQKHARRASNADPSTTELLRALRAFDEGDFAVRMQVPRRGPAADVARAMNRVLAKHERFASELHRTRVLVGCEGRVAKRVSIGEVGGGWRRSVDSVNALIDDLVRPTTEVGRVIGAVAAGDLSQSMALDIDGRRLRGEFLRTAKVVNGMVGQLGSFASEVTRVAREVGTEGKLGGQAAVEGVAGTWKDLTDSVNLMAGNLTAQVRNIAKVTTAVAEGDLSKKITVDVKGEILQLKTTINTMVDQLNSFASEVTRVAREVGTEGKLGGQAQVRGVGGTWKDLTDHVNSMASNLTAQVRNIADVTTAVARGDLTKKITVDVRGEILELKNTINTMVDRLNGFASEVTRVAREVGTEGKLGGQARVQGVAGTWQDLTDGVNFMASNLTAQVRNIAEVTTAVAKGDLSKKITVDVRGEILELKDTINTMVDQLNAFAAEVTRVAREVGTEGRLGGQARVQGVAGTWQDLTDGVNFMASNLTAQVRNIADVTTAVANGDLSKKITVDVKGEILQLKETINTMVDQLNAFASEVTRVAREVGTEGKLGGQAQVRGVAGTWKDLTDNVNSMASNLTDQVRGIATVVTAVANGDLTRTLALEAHGEIAQLADTINSMTRTLATFAEQVTTVAREVGVEGQLGGQAKVPGAAGTWRDLTDNVNQLAGNLTTQVRAIADVATAVTKGDLTRSITVEASGEVAALKENINEMIRNLKDTTQKTMEEDWLKTNLAKFTRMLQGQRDLATVARQILSELAPLVAAQHGIFYLASADGPGGAPTLRIQAGYAIEDAAAERAQIALGEGLVGQCALEKRRLLLADVPEGYVRVSSGLGSAPPRSIIVLPVLFEGQVNAVIELATFERFSEIHQTFLSQLTESIGIVINTIAASMRTEALLAQSQTLTHELQLQQEELRQTNERLERQAATLRESEERLKHQQDELRRTNEQLGEKAKLLELKNREVELAKEELEEKAEQLALTSKYKSEFLANMSHELRTPLNSLLILSKMLSDNGSGNLQARQVEFARTIHASGTDLLALISDILDLSKIESGTISVEPADVPFDTLRDYLEQSFRHVAEQRALGFRIVLSPDLPGSIRTDVKRLQQVLKNLLSNAFKFTEQGEVTLEVGVARSGWSRDQTLLATADMVVAFAVRDTGMGIPEDKQRIIFEAFQQADGTTSRKYGGTGLGLSISRELARLLGGEIRVVSTPRVGSTFTLLLPRSFRPVDSARPLVAEPDTGELRRLAPVATLAAAPPATDDAAPGERPLVRAAGGVLVAGSDDAALAAILVAEAEARGMQAIVAGHGDVAVRAVRKLAPRVAVLEVGEADPEAWLALDALKEDGAVRHVPVAIVGAPADEGRALRLGAYAFIERPASRSTVAAVLDRVTAIHAGAKTVLVALTEQEQRDALVARLEPLGLELRLVHDGASATAAIEEGQFACAVVGGSMRREALDAVVSRPADARANGPTPPLVLFAKRSSVDDAVRRVLRRGPVTLAQSLDAVVDRLLLHLHVPEADLPDATRTAVVDARRSVPALAGAKILVVDDDVRNIFAVTSILEIHQASVLYAESGVEAIRLLDTAPDVDAVLMDIMMPEMTGYEAIRVIRENPRFAQLPIIALTAKAMRADRDECLRSGASDYIAKPVDVERLLALLRVWLS